MKKVVPFGIMSQKGSIGFNQLTLQPMSKGQVDLLADYALGNSKTFVRIVNSGFEGAPDELITQIIDSTGGFTIVLAGLKAYLEHDIQLNLVADRFPKELKDE